MLNSPTTRRSRLPVHAARIGVAVGAMFVTLITVGGHADAQTPSTADLQLQMTTTPANVEPGGTFTYNATITNLGPDPTVSTQFQVDIVPATAATIIAATPSVGSCNVQPDAVLCGTLGPVAPNASVTVTVTVQVGASALVGTVITGNALTNAPSVPDPSSGNNNVIVTNNVVAPQATTTTTTTAPATTTTAPALSLIHI